MSLLFRPIRLILVCGTAFVAGMFYERSNQSEACTAANGTWSQDGICVLGAAQ